ncbi:MAG TPA: hypothetical protein VFZ00_11440, partial [Solirubrobacter sp.]|nr:hypothetical protein [Solirubrobacter sp.]
MKKIVVLALAITGLLPAAAEAGPYHVYSCAAAGRTWANNAWRPSADIPGVNHDTNCTGGIGLVAPAGARMGNNTFRTLSFHSPAGTTIADFTFTRHIRYTNPTAEDTHRYYLLYTLGSTHFAGGGNCCNPTRTALNSLRSWYGYPESNFSIARTAVTLRSFPALNAYAGNANALYLRLGCFDRGSACSVAAGGRIEHWLYGSDITINDPTRPAVTVEASGLLAGGGRGGSDPVTVTATDNSGIRKVELFDVTNAAAPVLVGVEDYAQVRTSANRVCDYSLPAPCPGLSRETVRATSLATGDRRVLVRVTDAGGNITNRGPYSVSVLTPSDRGALNGANATETATLDVSWTASSKRSRTLGYSRRAGIRGRLVNSAGVPITGARVALLTRDLRRNAPVVVRDTLTTDANGQFRTTVRASASRLLQFGWLSHANDVRFAANGYLTLRARASARLSVSTRRPRLGRRFTISGRLRGVSRDDVTVIVQGRARGQRRYSTFADTTTTRSGR